MRRVSAPKRERVARGIRVAILRGDYPDGCPLSPQQLSAEYGVNPEVVRGALWDLKREGHVSPDGRHRFHVNASHLSHQLQLLRNEIGRLERYAGRILVILGEDPCRVR
jgi:DNA-binding GntR family transcriptional regulator